jgi:hypothetical protein
MTIATAELITSAKHRNWLARVGLHSTARRAAVVLMSVVALIMGLGVTSASATTVVAGHTFTDSGANCAPSSLRIYVGGNTNDYSGGRYVRVLMYDYSAAQWVYGPWNAVTPGWGMTLTNQFNFGHHGYYSPELQYAVSTSSGWAYGVERFTVFGQTNSSGYTSNSNYCYI